MKKLFICFIAFCALGMSACITTTSSPSFNKKKAVISLDGNPTTGYTWTYSQAKDYIVREVSTEYKAKKPSAIGKGGTFFFVFEGINKGETELIFEYLRPWETDAKPIETKNYIFEVDTDKNISFKEKKK
ncbi:MAG: protease inhibitor I42 family protein [Endomicrobia bacterium]|nr:protease inhibitor I42 family protein [Endomicrobiia bacterium]